MNASSLLDPRVAIVVFAVMVTVALAIANSIAAIAIVLVWTLAVFARFGGGMAVVGVALRRLLPLLAVVVVLNGIAVPGRAAVTVFGWRALSIEGLAAGTFFALRLVAMAMAAVGLVRAAPSERFASGVHALVRPVSRRWADRLSLYGFLSMSFVPLFVDEFARIQMAQSFRAPARSRRWLDRPMAMRMLVVPLFLSAIHRSQQLAMVVELRGLRNRSFATRLRMNAGDVAIALGSGIVAALALAVASGAFRA